MVRSSHTPYAEAHWMVQDPLPQTMCVSLQASAPSHTTSRSVAEEPSIMVLPVQDASPRQRTVHESSDRHHSC